MFNVVLVQQMYKSQGEDGGLFIVYNQLKLIVLLEIYGSFFYFS